MAFSARLLSLTALALASSGCATLGSNINGDFTCRAPKGDCAPSHVIDQRATAELGRSDLAALETARDRAGIASGDVSRTSERTIRVVFPAHVDETGTLHDEAVAWAVVEKPQWTGELRRKDRADAPPLMRELRKRLKTAQSVKSEPPAAMTEPAPPNAPDTDPAGTADTASTTDASPFSIASPLALPSTAAEAVAGAHAPAVEGFDMSPPPHDRTPRPQTDIQQLTYPSAEALEAAKAKKPASDTAAGTAKEQK